jgi:Fe-S oxidoreductase
MIGTDYQVMGGPTHCCGTAQLRAGDIDTLGRFANNTINKLTQSKTKQVLAWCPSCKPSVRGRGRNRERAAHCPFRQAKEVRP